MLKAPGTKQAPVGLVCDAGAICGGECSGVNGHMRAGGGAAATGGGQRQVNATARGSGPAAKPCICLQATTACTQIQKC